MTNIEERIYHVEYNKFLDNIANEASKAKGINIGTDSINLDMKDADVEYKIQNSSFLKAIQHKLEERKS